MFDRQASPRRAGSCVILVVVLASGCGGGPPALKPPDIDATAAGAAAIAQFDTDGDGLISGDELRAAPFLDFALDRMDDDGDGKISAAEVAGLVGVWEEEGAGVIRVRCSVTLGGRKLDAATVTFVPAEFLGGDALKPASGVTRDGFAPISMSAEDAAEIGTAAGVIPGLYLVRVSKMVNGEEAIPAKYNTATTLGVEVASRASYMPGAIHLVLDTR